MVPKPAHLVPFLPLYGTDFLFQLKFISKLGQILFKKRQGTNKCLTELQSVTHTFGDQLHDLFPNVFSKAGLEPSPRLQLPPYLALPSTVLLLGGWDDFQGDGPLGLSLEAERAQAYCLPGLTPYEFTPHFPGLKTHGRRKVRLTAPL